MLYAKTQTHSYPNCGQFADAMHEHGKKLSVDVASWSEIWNLTALAMTSVDRLITMSTYTNSTAFYYVGLGAALTTVPLNKLGIGFECALTLSHRALKSRIDDMLVSGVQEIDVWVTPIPNNWWSELERYASAN